MKDEKKFPWYDDNNNEKSDEVKIPREVFSTYTIHASEDLDDDCMEEDGEWDYCDESPFDESPFDEPPYYDTPQKIFEYLDSRVYKQTEAKKAAAMIAYKAFVRGIRENALFVGPSGCGKTYIWKMLQEIFPDRIEIVDASNITKDGWSGGKKWHNLLASPIFQSGQPCVLVLDEADKMFTPQYNSRHHENVSHEIQGEGLKMIEGCRVGIKGDSGTYYVNTAKISFVLCGAFNSKAEDMAEKASGSRLGFCSNLDNDVKAYEKPIAEKDLLDFGVIPEFLGRIQRIVNLERITEEDYLKMLDSSSSPVERIERVYDCEIDLSTEKKREIAEKACKLGLGVRGMENTIRQMLDDAMFEEPEKLHFAF